MTSSPRASLPRPLAPGAVIGILGGGQLGRMSALAAAQLGYRSHVFCPQADAPATQVTPLATRAAYDDREALIRFARAVDVVTYEFENIPFAAAETVAAYVPVHPAPSVLHICQNRLREKAFCTATGVPTARHAEITDVRSLHDAVAAMGRPCVLKTAELGYDGKGQVLITAETDLDAVWAEQGRAAATVGLILEAFIDFRMEISVIVARGADGARRTYVPVENQHRNHILDQTIVPARVPSRVADKAEGIARHLAEEIGLIGLLAIEMFVTTDDEVLVNELAPRPHNSGHWTLDACITSQFEQLVRAVAGLPLGATDRLADAVMKNLIGAEVEQAQAVLADPAVKLHLYGKSEVRPGRKMGHTTRIIQRTS
ncbi:MAG: 5-(carboxyamino)imidazole ribonucleotide synthase [Alphaproteobacteria bacterium]|nr:MAG: 5-(carboxyamino)imidazole ribonucleotide synthase [Alphaproteobacteria bacterium]